MAMSDWVANRKKRGTLADVARRMVERDVACQEAERQLRRLITVEVLIKNGCELQASIGSSGMSRAAIYRNLKPFVMADVIAAAKAIKEAK